MMEVVYVIVSLLFHSCVWLVHSQDILYYYGQDEYYTESAEEQRDVLEKSGVAGCPNKLGYCAGSLKHVDIQRVDNPAESLYVNIKSENGLPNQYDLCFSRPREYNNNFTSIFADVLSVNYNNYRRATVAEVFLFAVVEHFNVLWRCNLGYTSGYSPSGNVHLTATSKTCVAINEINPGVNPFGNVKPTSYPKNYVVYVMSMDNATPWDPDKICKDSSCNDEINGVRYNCEHKQYNAFFSLHVNVFRGENMKVLKVTENGKLSGTKYA